MQNIPLFGSSASLISPPAGTVTSGYFPLQYLPAENLNYYLNAATQSVQEWVNLETLAGLTPSTAQQGWTAISGLVQTINPLIRNVYQGLILTYVSTTSFSVGAGVVADSSFQQIMDLSTLLIKTTSAWAVGGSVVPVGGLDTGTIAANTWYYVYIIKRVDTGVVDMLYSASPTAPTMPANYTLKRLIGAVKTDGSSHWVQWIMYADGTQAFKSIVSDVADSTLTTARKSYTMTTLPNLTCLATIAMYFSNITGVIVYVVSDTNITDVAPSTDPVVGTIIQQTGSAGYIQKARFIFVSNVIYARSTAATTVFNAACADFNVRPYN